MPVKVVPRCHGLVVALPPMSRLDGKGPAVASDDGAMVEEPTCWIKPPLVVNADAVQTHRTTVAAVWLMTQTRSPTSIPNEAPLLKYPVAKYCAGVSVVR